MLGLADGKPMCSGILCLLVHGMLPAWCQTLGSGELIAISPLGTEPGSWISNSLPVFIGCMQYWYEVALLSIGIAVGFAVSCVVCQTMTLFWYWPLLVPRLLVKIFYMVISGVGCMCSSFMVNSMEAGCSAHLDAAPATSDAPNTPESAPESAPEPHHTANTVVSQRANALEGCTNTVLTSLIVEIGINPGRPTKELMVLALSHCQIATGKQLLYMRSLANRKRLTIPVTAMISISNATDWITANA